MSIEYCVHCLTKLPGGHGETCPQCGKPWREVEQTPCCLPPFTMLRGKYLVGKRLAQGGFGITYNGIDLTLDVRVAIKEFFLRDISYRIGSYSTQILWDDTCAQSDQWQDGKKSFLQEARVMAKIRTVPEIVRVLDMFEENNTAYIVMDYVEGETIRDFILKNGTLHFNAAVSFLRPVITAMQIIHEQGILHRDLSPNNIMLEKNSQLRILDLGAAKETVNSNHTEILQKVAKKYYSSYEQHMNLGTSTASDVYSLCGVLYFCVTGKDPQDALERAKKDELQFPDDIFTPAEAMIMRRAMAVNCEQRIQTMGEFLMALEMTTEKLEEETEYLSTSVLEELEAASKEARQTGEAGYIPATAPEKPQAAAKEMRQVGEASCISAAGPKKNDAAAEKLQKAGEVKQARQQPASLHSKLSAALRRARGESPETGVEPTEERKAVPAEEPKAPVEAPPEKPSEAAVVPKKVEAPVQEAVVEEPQEIENAHEQCDIGIRYYSGIGVKQDFGKAVEWFSKSASQGNANAQNNLGTCYYSGRGVPQDYVEAVKLYFQAANQGNANAQFNLGTCYASGQGVERNYEEAVKWYRMAAEQDVIAAQRNLGKCYETGKGVNENRTEALKWFQRAASRGDAEARYKLGDYYYNGYNYSEAAKWFRKSAAAGFSDAECSLGICYANGHGVEKDLAEAQRLYRRAARKGHVRAQYLLGTCFQHGFGVEKNAEEAKKWYRQAASQGSSEAAAALARMS